MNETRKFNKDPILVCERQSTYHQVFYFCKNKHFVQSYGPRKRQGQNQRFYAGTYKTSNDTVYMAYYNEIRPDSMATYLIKEPSSKFLVYPYNEIKDTIRLSIIEGHL